MSDPLPFGLPEIVAAEEGLTRILRSSGHLSSTMVKRAAFPAKDGTASVIQADEPPPRHANIVEWPVDADPDLQKARQKEIALAIASQSILVKVEA
jgi:hypothetical protein